MKLTEGKIGSTGHYSVDEADGQIVLTAEMDGIKLSLSANLTAPIDIFFGHLEAIAPMFTIPLEAIKGAIDLYLAGPPAK